MTVKPHNHPKALPYLFLTEMWERFGFYVVQGMLVLYMTKSFGFSDEKSFTILGSFTALAYIAPMIGGFLADAFLGFKIAILWGGLFLIIGYALMALPSTYAFYFALATIIVGTGLFKPNISSLLGALYPRGDMNRDSGFTIFYIGINLGAMLAGISSGAIKNHFGWHVAFGLGSLGLVIGLITFWIGLKWGDVKSNSVPVMAKNNKFYYRKPFLLFYCIGSVGLLSALLQSKIIGEWFFPALGIILLIFMFTLAARQPQPDRQRLFLLNFLIISSIVFWALYWQMFFSANLFIDRVVDKQLFGFEIPTTAFYSLESIFIILLGPGLAWSWQTLNRSNMNPSPLIKFIFAIVFIGVGFLVLGFSTYFYNASHLVNPLWIVLSYFLITVGEMLLSPIGLSAVTIYSPTHLTGMMMGIWFVALGFGGQVAGVLAKLSSVSESAKESLTQLPIYRAAFLDYAYLSLGVAAVLILLHILFRKQLDID